jgi:hypothetical protein
MTDETNDPTTDVPNDVPPNDVANDVVEQDPVGIDDLASEDRGASPYDAVAEIEIPHDIADIYRVALADFRLRRAGLMPPCIAAIIDAVFLLIDPLDRQKLFQDGEAARAYDDLAGRVWLRLTAVLMIAAVYEGMDDDGEMDPDALDDDGEVTVTIPELPRNVLHRIVLEEVQTSLRGDVSECPTNDDFAEIVGREFGEQVAFDDNPPCAHVLENVDVVTDMILGRLVRSSLFD